MKIIQKLNQISFKKVIWLLAITETIHNLEEAIWLPKWSQTAGIWHPSTGTFEFRFAVTFFTLLFYGLIYYYTKHDNKFGKYLISGLLVIILFNVFMPHLLATIALGKYAPGVISGLLLNVPAAIYLISRGMKENEFTYKTLIIGGVCLMLAMLPLLPASFALGRFIEYIF